MKKMVRNKLLGDIDRTYMICVVVTLKYESKIIQMLQNQFTKFCGVVVEMRAVGGRDIIKIKSLFLSRRFFSKRKMLLPLAPYFTLEILIFFAFWNVKMLLSHFNVL